MDSREQVADIAWFDADGREFLAARWMDSVVFSESVVRMDVQVFG